jgi:hypothetical protein
MATSSPPDNSDYVVLDGLSIEMKSTSFEVYFTPDIDIPKNFSHGSATSSIHGETGAPIVKHLHTFSQEESEMGEVDLFNFSICSTNDEEEKEDEKLEKRTDTTDGKLTAENANEEDTENTCPPGRYRRPRDSFGQQPQAKNQHQILNIVTSFVPPTNTHDEQILLKELDSTSPRVLGELSINSPQNVGEKNVQTLKVKVSSINTKDVVVIPKELDPRSPRVLGEMCINSPQNGTNTNKDNDVKLSVRQKIRGWENYVLSSGVLPAPSQM